jgi:hypothetical protein
MGSVVVYRCFETVFTDIFETNDLFRLEEGLPKQSIAAH